LLGLLGALLVLSSNIDPKSTQRPAPPVFSAFTSADGVVNLEYAKTWSPMASTPTTPTTPLSYVFTPAGSNSSLIGIRILAPSALGIPGVTDRDTPSQILSRALPQLSAAGEPQVQLRDVKAGNLSGVGYHRVSVASANAPAQEAELWLLSLDPTHVVLIQGISPLGEWTDRLEPIFTHMMDTLSIDTKAALAITPAPAPTAAATQPVTAATAVATAAH
jgi:hypothetical protein